VDVAHDAAHALGASLESQLRPFQLLELPLSCASSGMVATGSSFHTPGIWLWPCGGRRPTARHPTCSAAQGLKSIRRMLDLTTCSGIRRTGTARWKTARLWPKPATVPPLQAIGPAGDCFARVRLEPRANERAGPFPLKDRPSQAFTPLQLPCSRCCHRAVR